MVSSNLKLGQAVFPELPDFSDFILLTSQSCPSESTTCITNKSIWLPGYRLPCNDFTEIFDEDSLFGLSPPIFFLGLRLKSDAC